MGVIRKKTVTRGTESGLKYICDVCSIDITSTVKYPSPSEIFPSFIEHLEPIYIPQVRIHCSHPNCNDYDLCVPCFSQGASSRDHVPSSHSFCVIEQHSIPIYTEDWGADEELLLLEGAEIYGLGSWADIADHIGGYRYREEVRDHYVDTYIKPPNFPLPALADPHDLTLVQAMPRDKFQIRKRRRIEERKEAAEAAPPQAPKQKPTASVPACHEVQGYMPGRLEFETEYANEAEEAVQSLQFDPGDGLNPRTGEPEPETELKLVVMDIYNARLTLRAERKRTIFAHELLDYRANAAKDKKRTKEERELFNRVKPFARLLNHDDFLATAQSVEYEHNLRQAIAQLQDWRHVGIGDLKTGEKYEHEKHIRALKSGQSQGTGVFDRQGGLQAGQGRNKPAIIVETPSQTIALTAPELPERLRPMPLQPHSTMANGNGLSNSLFGTTNGRANGLSNGLVNGNTPKDKAVEAARQALLAPLLGIQPLKLGPDNAEDLHILTKEEAELCSVVRMLPKAYMVVKEALIREAVKGGGTLKKRVAREVCKVCTFA